MEKAKALEVETFSRWKKQPFPHTNYILHPIGKVDFAISYNPAKELWCKVPAFNPDTPRGETAICDYRQDGGYYILNGDYRQQYEAIVDDGIEACIKFFLAQPLEERSSWCTGLGKFEKNLVN